MLDVGMLYSLSVWQDPDLIGENEGGLQIRMQRERTAPQRPEKEGGLDAESRMPAGEQGLSTLMAASMTRLTPTKTFICVRSEDLLVFEKLLALNIKKIYFLLVSAVVWK